MLASQENVCSGVSVTSMRTDTTWRYSVFGQERLGRGGMLFTGPDGIRDHRVRVEDEHRYVGEGTMSPEGTSEVAYLWRTHSGMSHPRPKTGCVGEIGWGIPSRADWSLNRSGQQIYLGEFRQAVEDRHTHLYQNPWYPDPNYKTSGEEQMDMKLTDNKDEHICSPSLDEKRRSSHNSLGSHQSACIAGDHHSCTSDP